MDFQKLLGKLDQIDLATSEPKAEKIATAPTTALTEDAQIRVLAGLSSILEEGRRIVDRETIVEKKLTAAEKDKKEEVVKSMKKDKDGFKDRYGKKGDEVMHATATKIAKKAAESIESIDEEDELDEVFDADAKVGDKKKTSSGVATKTATGMKHEKTYSDDEDSKDSGKKKAAKESFRAKFDAMVEAKKGSKPDFLDIDKDGDKKEPMKKAVADKKKGAAPKKGVNPFAKKDESVKESDDMKVGDKKKSSTGGTIEKTKTGVKHTAGKNYGGKAAEDEAKKSKKDESVVRNKKVVAESVEQRMSFKQCLQMVKESGGQQQIDPVDGELWKWAQRVASAKVEESAARDAMAAFVYERMGGDFQLYDVLSENQK